MDRKDCPRAGDADLARVSGSVGARHIHAHVELGGEKDQQDRQHPKVDSIALHIRVPSMNERMGDKVVSSS